MINKTSDYLFVILFSRFVRDIDFYLKFFFYKIVQYSKNSWNFRDIFRVYIKIIALSKSYMIANLLQRYKYQVI